MSRQNMTHWRQTNREPDGPAAEADLLLPWYVNGSLGEDEMNLVNAQRGSEDFDRALEEELALAELVNREVPAIKSLSTSRQQGFAELTATIRRERQGPRWWAVAAAAVLLCVVGLAPAVLDRPVMPYQTLTNAGAPARAPVLQVIFQPDTPERDMRALLLDGGARLLSGPSRNGVYRLELPPDAEAGAYAKRLQQHPAVRWAEVELR